MRPSELLSAKVTPEGLLVLEAMGPSQIDFFGASTEASAAPNTGALTNLTVRAPGDEGFGVVALRVRDRRGRNEVHYPLLLGMTHAEANMAEPPRPRIELERQAELASDALGQVTWHGIQVIIRGQCYSCEASGRPAYALHVPDPNLLCRFLAGHATEDDVRAAAEEQTAELSAREELEQLRREITRFGNIPGEVRTVAEIRNAFKRITDDHNITLLDMHHYRSLIMDAHAAIRELFNAKYGRRWGRGRRVRNAIDRLVQLMAELPRYDRMD